MNYTWKTQGFILKRIPFKEADRLYTLYTRDNGKIIVQATGIRKTISKLAGHTEPFMLSSFFIAKGKYFDRLAGSSVQKTFRNIRSSLDAIHVVQNMIETVDHFTKENQKDDHIYELIEKGLLFLDSKPLSKNILWLFIYTWQWQFLHAIGYKPHLHDCMEGGGHTLDSEPEIFFDIAKGGVVCKNHMQNNLVIKINPKVLELLSLAQNNDFEILKNTTATRRDWSMFITTIQSFFEYNAGKIFSSSLFLPQWPERRSNGRVEQSSQS